MLIFAASACVSTSEASGEDVGIVTFTVDDLSTSFFELAYPVFKKNSIPGTLFGRAARLQGDSGEYYVPRVRQLVSDGWEFGAHGNSHLDMTKLSCCDLFAELGSAAAIIYRTVGIYPTTLASPFGRYDEHVLQTARNFYDAQVRAWGNRGFNSLNETDHFKINRSRVAKDRYESPNAVCDDMAKAGRDREWLVLLFHGFRPETTLDQKYAVPLEWLDTIVQCAVDLRASETVKLLTVRDALQHVPEVPSR